MTSINQDWDVTQLQFIDQQLAKCASAYGLEIFPNQYEIVTYQQMIESQAAMGLPILYPHWSFGKKLVDLQNYYLQGLTTLAYEMVINANPCISYLMADNSFIMQIIVMAHAGYGHNSFFKNNYLFKEWTQPDGILDYLVFARQYINECETRYGSERVSSFLDSCHALMPYGIHPNHSLLRPAISAHPHHHSEQSELITASENEENLLYCFEKYAPGLQNWEREIIRIVRKLAHYFYPQRRTKVMNEGWACFWHYQLLHELYDKQVIDDNAMIEFYRIHTNVLSQPAFDDQQYHGLNPYVLGFNIFKDLKRIATAATPEDRMWFPELVDRPWYEVIDFAMRNFSDSDFIAQYLSPTVIRTMKLFCLRDDSTQPDLEITAIHDEEGYAHCRKTLAENYAFEELQPRLKVNLTQLKQQSILQLEYQEYLHRPLNAQIMKILEHIHSLWRAPVQLDVYTSENTISKRYDFPLRMEQ